MPVNNSDQPVEKKNTHPGKKAAPIQPKESMPAALSDGKMVEYKNVPEYVRTFVALINARGYSVSYAQFCAMLCGENITPRALMRASLRLGVATEREHIEKVLNISSLLFPCLLLTKNDSAIILYKIQNNKAEIKLPNGTTSIIDVETIENEYCGQIMMVSQRLSAHTTMTAYAKQGGHWFKSVILHYKPLYSKVIMISFVTNLLTLLGPLFFMNVYDRVIPNSAFDTLWVLATGICFGYIFEFLLRYCRNRLIQTVGRNVDIILSNSLMQKLLSIKMFNRPASSGALLNCLGGFEHIRAFFNTATLVILVDFPFMVFFLWLVWYFAGLLVFVPLAGIFVVLGATWIFKKAVASCASQVSESYSSRQARLVEIIGGIEDIKVAGAEYRMGNLWEQTSAWCAKQTDDSRKLNDFIMGISSLVTHFVSIGFIICGVYLISTQKMTIGGLIACNMLSGRAMSFITQFSSSVVQFKNSWLSLQELTKFMSQECERGDTDVTETVKDVPCSYELEDVTFTYKDAKVPALKNISLKIKAGERVAILGNMGSGKSTLSRLLAGLYIPERGFVRFGGVDTRRADLAEMRQRVSFLAQNPVLFTGTARENVGLGVPDATDSQLDMAAYYSGALDFIRKNPAGWSLPITERGDNLSGGQRQTLALARALIKSPSVLILDEPTSNVDSLTEGNLRDRLSQFGRDKTIIISMHRMGLIDMMDRIIVLNEGSIVLDAPRDEALAKIRGETKRISVVKKGKVSGAFNETE